MAFETQAETLDDVPPEGWRVWTGTLAQAPDLSFSCLECNSDTDCGLDRGKCEDNICKRNEDACGTFCAEDKRTCPWMITFYPDHKQLYQHCIFQRLAYRLWSTCGLCLGKRLDGYYEVFMFTGRRLFDTEWTPQQVDELGNETVHGYWSNLLPGKMQ